MSLVLKSTINRIETRPILTKPLPQPKTQQESHSPTHKPSSTSFSRHSITSPGLPSPENLAKNMDDHETRAWKMIHQSAVPATISAVSLRLSVSLIAMVLLLWAAWGGFKLATDSDRYKIHADWAFCLGILTILFGFLFLILALPIVADLFLNLSEQLQEEAGIQKGLNRMNDLGARETKTITQVTARIFGTLVTMLMLWWTIYTGFKLTTEPKHSKYYILTTSIGVIAIIFGMIYFTIGLAIIAELGLDLSSDYQRAKHNKNHHHQLSRLKR